MNIAITGATGQLGQLVIHHLFNLSSEHHLIALVRNIEKAQAQLPKGIKIRHFDYDKPESLTTALLGVDKLLLISANEIGRRTAQHQAVIEAAQASQVPYIAYTSLLNADHSSLGLAQEHRETEKLIQESGLSYTLLRNNWYIENYLGALTQAIQHGAIYGASGDGQISAASRDEYAEAIARVLLTDTHLNKTYELASNQSFTKANLAQAISEVSQQPVQYNNLSPEAFEQLLLQVGLDEGFASFLADVDAQTQDGVMYSQSQDLQTLLGRPTANITSILQKLI
ncbi:SDR family oxidoreductase [Acinetobacter indicus]|uniref:SDR family oxidoreductase n=1 Tax=Acinetobacter indicus TaxID=756892 RepID=UPI000CEC6930|nr:SDR family oxidoreductase [Acinetobacter indicus]